MTRDLNFASSREFAYFLLALFFLLMGPAITMAQSDPTRVVGGADQGLPLPEEPLVSTTLDPTALDTIVGFVKATNGAKWSGIQANGNLTDAISSAPNPAALTISGDIGFRLDVTLPSGEQSTRIYGDYGEIREANGFTHTLPFRTARMGLIAFPRLLDSTFPDAQTTILNRGIVTIGSTMLHRITVQEPAPSWDPAPTSVSTSVVDLYFDPVTNLLAKSAALVQLDPMDRERYFEVITYGNYKTVNGILMPFFYSQTLNGQPQWSIQLTNAQQESSLDSSYFQF